MIATTVFAPSPDSARRGNEASRSAARSGVNPATSTRKEYSSAKLEFMAAVDAYKRQKSRPFPTLTEIHDIFTALGYEKAEAHAHLVVRSRRSRVIT